MATPELTPRVSVVIPAYHSDGTIEACLEGLRGQSFRDFEAIVVNSSPEDRTRAIVARFPEVVFEHSTQRLLPHAARNRGAQRARGEIIVFTDPDCRAEPGWLLALVEAHDSGHAVVAGSIDVDGESALHRGMHLCKFSWRLSGLEAGPTRVVQTANACYSRVVWEAAGPFDGRRMSGDVLLSLRVAERGWTPWFEPRAVVKHRHEGGSASFLRERFQRGADGAATRAEFEGWSRLRYGVYLTALPILPLLLTLRTGRDSYKGGHFGEFLVTLPLQLTGHGAWCLGEARLHLRRLVGR